MTLIRDESEPDFLAEFEELIAANAKATSWGAAVGARDERIRALRELLKHRLSINAQYVAKDDPKTLWGMIAAIYGQLDAEDCAWVDREWAKMRGYIIPTDGTSTLTSGQSPIRNALHEIVTNGDWCVNSQGEREWKVSEAVYQIAYDADLFGDSQEENAGAKK